MLIKTVVIVALLAVAFFLVYLVAAHLPRGLRVILSRFIPDPEISAEMQKDREIERLRQLIASKDDLLKELQLKADEQLPYQVVRAIDEHYERQNSDEILREVMPGYSPNVGRKSTQ